MCVCVRDLRQQGRQRRTVPNRREEQLRSPPPHTIGAMPEASNALSRGIGIGFQTKVTRDALASSWVGDGGVDLDWWRANNNGGEVVSPGLRQEEAATEEAGGSSSTKPERRKEKPGDYLKRLGATKRVQRAAQLTAQGDFATALRNAAAGRS